jgi:two-component system, response regulator
MIPKDILLIEDNTSDAGLTLRAFKKANITNRIVVVEDGEEAIDYLFCEGKYPDRDISDMPALILLDLNLPKLNGFEVLRRIRSDERTKRLLVVILTSSKEEQDIAAGYDLGVNSYIRKPIDFNQFIDAISQLGMYWLIINEPPPMMI